MEAPENLASVLAGLLSVVSPDVGGISLAHHVLDRQVVIASQGCITTFLVEACWRAIWGILE